MAVHQLVVFITVAGIVAASSPNHNILFIGVDDLRPELQPYGYDFMHTPNVARLADSGTLFSRAYCQEAVCSPSRTSLLTGLRPDSTRVWDIGPYFRKTMPNGADVVTLSQYFMAHGYEATGVGKIWHPGSSSGGPARNEGGADMPYSWSQPYFFCDQFLNDTVQSTAMQDFPNGTGCVQSQECVKCFEKAGTWGNNLAWATTDCADACYPEGLIADEAIRRIKSYGNEARRQAKPFFLAVGFKRPHLSYKAPNSYFNLYPNSSIKLAARKIPPENAPSVAFYPNSEIHGLPDVAPYVNNTERLEALPDWLAHNLRRAYYSSVSLTDHHLGRVLDALDEAKLSNDTIVAFWGDHGYQLGELGEWGKCTNYELATRVPLIIRSPSQKQAGQTSSALVELVDLFPTLVDLAGLPAPPFRLEGRSLAPLLDDPNTEWSYGAFSQFPRADPTEPKLSERLMGYTIRSDKWRYTAWVEFDWENGEPRWDKVHGVELYDHNGDVGTDMNTFEAVNLASEPGYKSTVDALHNQLIKGWNATIDSDF
eukprot:m.311308 g.311308  ORF g.311308 m.311308 type:complete len:539 (+) comp64854_c0_seq1:54-1670(+)